MTTLVTQLVCQDMVMTGTGWDMVPMITSVGRVDQPGGGRGSEPSLAPLTWHLDVSGEELILYHCQEGDQRYTKRR